MLEGKKKYNSIMIKIVLTLILLAIQAFAMPKVAVSIAPQKYFLEQIMGKDADITVLVPTGASPATYAPKPSQLKALKQVSLYFTIGVPFEKNWLDRFKSIHKTMQIIDTTKDIHKLPMHEDEHHEHEHSGLDPHVWLSPTLVIKQAHVMKEALISIDAENAKRYEANFLRFQKRILKLNDTITKILSPLKQRSFIVFHPSFGYFAKDFSLTQIAIEKEGKEPSLRYLKRVIDFAKSQHITTIFVAPQFSQKAAAQIAKQVGAKVVTIDPLAYDWETNLRKVAQSFENADRG